MWVRACVTARHRPERILADGYRPIRGGCGPADYHCVVVVPVVMVDDGAADAADADAAAANAGLAMEEEREHDGGQADGEYLFGQFVASVEIHEDADADEESADSTSDGNHVNGPIGIARAGCGHAQQHLSPPYGEWVCIDSGTDE